METSEVIKSEKTDTQPFAKGRILPADELKRLTDLFSLLIQIDRRENVTKKYAKQIK